MSTVGIVPWFFGTSFFLCLAAVGFVIACLLLMDETIVLLSDVAKRVRQPQRITIATLRGVFDGHDVEDTFNMR